MISYDLMYELAIPRFDHCGAVAKDCSSVFLDAIQEKTTLQTQPNEPEAAELCLDEYIIVRFPLSNEINATKTDSSVKATVYIF